MIKFTLKLLILIFFGILFSGCASSMGTVNRFAPSHSTFISFEQILRVIKSTPEYRMVTIRTPYQECWNEQTPVNSGVVNNNMGALVGGVAGGILGHQVGGGSGKTAATVGGAIIGTLVGKNLSQNQNSGTTYRNQKRCVTKYKMINTEKFVGYKNIANYENRTIIKYSDKPLKIIRLHLNVSY